MLIFVLSRSDEEIDEIQQDVIESKLKNRRKSIKQKSSVYIREKLFKQISSERLSKKLKRLTRKPFIGEKGMDENTLFVYKRWTNLGMETSFANYSVLMSFPDKNKPNSVTKYDGSGQVIYKTPPFEDPLSAPPNKAKFYKQNPPYLAYSPSTPQPLKGTPIYVNYGTYDDYEYLEKLKINVHGHFVIARYGKTFRGNIVSRAEEKGALGVIIYSDPFDYTDGNLTNTFPDSIYLPKTGVQRGLIRLSDGDPLTPFYPSVESAFRLPLKEANLPKIPVQSISYGDAQYILHGLKGPKAPQNWTGLLKLDYKLGPGYEDNSYLTLEVNNYRKQSVIHNVIGVIEGCIEPDRYVLIGNHRDAWTFGAVDPLSGTASLLELSEAITKVIRKEEWCPRRGIVFCSWDAEEYGLLGSTEWVEENQKSLQSQAIAYINVDSALSGNYTLQAAASPLLYETVWSATKFVTNPNSIELKEGLKTIYDSYKLHRPSNSSGILRPDIETPGSGSDFTPFLQFIGVPVVDLFYDCNKTRIKCYPLYHTMYETYEMVSTLIDPTFSYLKGFTQVIAEMIRSLSDTPLLPFADSLEYYPRFLEKAAIDLKSSKFIKTFGDNNIDLEHLVYAIYELKTEINAFKRQIKESDLKNELNLRRVNDLLMQLDRAFIDSQGLPFRKDWKNVLMAPSAMDSYEGSTFSGIHDLLWKYNHEINETKRMKTLNQIREQYSVVVFHINAAKLLIKQTFG